MRERGPRNLHSGQRVSGALNQLKSSVQCLETHIALIQAMFRAARQVLSELVCIPFLNYPNPRAQLRHIHNTSPWEESSSVPDKAFQLRLQAVFQGWSPNSSDTIRPDMLYVVAATRFQ